MSIQDGGGMVSYADHDVHHVLHGVQWRSNATSGPSDALTSERQFEITERGLDPDELAELRAMRVNVSTITSTTVNQGNPGTVQAFIGAGYNLSGDEYLQASTNTDGVDTNSDGTDDFIVRTKDTDEVGQLFAFEAQETVNFADQGNSVGGAANDSSVSELIPFADLFGSGPFVDAADDFTSRIRLNVADVLETVEIKAMYTLYYDVDQVEGGRSRFGR